MEAAFFDLDKTIVARSSPLALGRSFFKEGLITRSALLKSAYAQLMIQIMGADEGKMERIRREAAKLTEGWEAENVKRIVTEVLDEVISPFIYAEALELIRDHRAAGRLVCLVSSSPEEIVEPMAKLLNIDLWIASQPRLVNGRYTGQLDFYAFGERKAEAMQALAEVEGVELERSFAYSDSITDRPMLEAVGNPVVVNPDKELRRVAARNGWRVEAFRNPIPLRGRLPQLMAPEVSPVMALGAGLTAAAGAGLAWWFLRKASRSD